MFTISAISHNSSKGNDAPLGGMHLNAINGSSDTFGANSLGGGSYFNQPKANGGLFGSSLSDSPLYRPVDAGSSYLNYGQPATLPSPTVCETKEESECRATSAYLYQTTSRQRQALECLRDSLKLSPDVPRRHSLDLDKSSSNRQYNEELLLSLDELDLDLASLNLTEMDTSVDNDLKSDSQTTDTTKRRRYHTTDSATAERAIKLLARIKENRQERSNKASKTRDVDDVTQGSSSSKVASGSSRHGVQRHWSEAGQQKDKSQSEVRRPKDKKLVSRSSFD
uniref:Uncharacterized protein n=1 Tax=Biomphalaria glabrata TaxID=6526 RepID=A0A2C9M8F9_BIOGL